MAKKQNLPSLTEKMINIDGGTALPKPIYATEPHAETTKNDQPTNTNPQAATNTVEKVTKQPEVTQPFTYDQFSYSPFSYEDYAPSDIVNQANAMLQQQIAAKPGAYQSKWQSQIDDYLGRIENRDPFSYNFNEDALYQLYKDMYTQQGRMAMMDTMGQAAAMTGGYGNSYAQTVGQQAYNQQLSQLNNVIPELYSMAFDRYAYEGQQLRDMYDMYLGREEQDYGRYMDSYNQWQAERDYLASRYDTERDYDYSKWESDRALDYDEHTANREIAWNNYLKNMENAETAADLMAAAGDYTRLAQLLGLSEEEVKALVDKNAPKGGPYTDTDAWDNEDLSESRIKELQKALGVTVDGKWGAESKAAAGGLGAAAAYDALRRGDFDDPKRAQGTMNTDYEYGVEQSRRDAIYDWLFKAYKNAGSNFNPTQLVEQSSWLKTQAERDYAKILVGSWGDLHK